MTLLAAPLALLVPRSARHPLSFSLSFSIPSRSRLDLGRGVQVFRADDSEITEEDIDTILRSAKNLTAEREEKLKVCPPGAARLTAAAGPSRLSPPCPRKPEQSEALRSALLVRVCPAPSAPTAAYGPSSLQDKSKRELLDFSNAEVNFQQFEGVDYKGFTQREQDMAFMEMMQDSVGKRERTNTSYNECSHLLALPPA